MIDLQEAMDAVSSVVDNNDDWRQILMDAPGGAALRLALAFYTSPNLDKWLADSKNRGVEDAVRENAQKHLDEYREFREKLDATLNPTELKYLVESYDRMGSESARDHFKDIFDKLPQEKKDEGERGYADIVSKIEKRRKANGGEDSFSWMESDDGEAGSSGDEASGDENSDDEKANGSDKASSGDDGENKDGE